MSQQPVRLSETIERLPPEWPTPLLPTIREQLAASGRTVVVLDDDPTGTQTVHNVPVLTEWSAGSLRSELAHRTPVFFILTNSRSLALPAAQALNTEIGRNLVAAARAVNRDFVVVSRSDSTLRGHYPGEVDALAAALGRPVRRHPDRALLSRRRALHHRQRALRRRWRPSRPRRRNALRPGRGFRLQIVQSAPLGRGKDPRPHRRPGCRIAHAPAHPRPPAPRA